MASRSFGVIIFSAMPPRDVARIASRIHKEVPGATVCGALYERRPPKTLWQRITYWVRSLRDWSYVTYVVAKVFHSLLKRLARMGSVLLRFVHACPASPNGPTEFELEDLARCCETIGGSLFVTADMHSPEALEFVRGLQPDLGIVYGTRVLKPELFNIPRNGSINIHKRKVPDYRGGGPVGLWELLDGQRQIGITVHQVAAELDAGAVIQSSTIPIDPYDNLESLALKADVVGNDLLVRATADFVRGSVQKQPQGGTGRMFRNPKPQALWRYQKQLAASRPAYRPTGGRPMWKLLLASLLFVPFVIFRNWFRRLRRDFPVIILYYHLVTDRPHHLGIPTALFLKQVEFLRKHYKPVSLSEAVEMLEKGTVEAPTMVLTFDDGYGDNFVNLRAVTEQTSIPITLFVCTENVTAQREFRHDLDRGQRGFLPLTWEQIEYLSQNGFEISAHTRSHFDCGSADREALEQEIVGSKTDLEQRLGRPVRFFSFPWGHPEKMSPLAVELAKTSYPYVLSAYGGVNVPSSKTKVWHLKRCGHRADLWELELQLQSVLSM